MSEFRTEADSLGRVEVPAEKLWGAQTQRSLQHFSIGQDLIPREMIAAYAILKRAAAAANADQARQAQAAAPTEAQKTSIKTLITRLEAKQDINK